MPTESSVVSHLIQQVRGGRLRTDPGDASLFQPVASAREPRSWRAPAIAVPQPRPIERPTPAPAVKRPAAPKRDRTWPWIAATLVAGAIGVAAAAYYPFGSDAPAAAVMPAPAAPIVAPIAAPAPPPAPASEPAPVEPPAPATTEPPAPEPTVAPAPPAPAKHHASHTKPKPKRATVAKHAKPQPAAAPAPAPEEEAPPPPPPPAPAKRAAQSADKENPL